MYLIWQVYILTLFSFSLATYVINIDDLYSKYGESDDLFDIEGFLDDYGYPFENHEITTEDDYVLTLFRIPHGKDEKQSLFKDTVKPTVLFVHGLLSNSLDFLMLGPEKSLAMLLADLGYDVWLANNRGTTWSRKHKSLDPDTDKDYWDFSFHELGVFDEPAIIDHVLEVSGNSNLTYIGHSQGTTQFFALTSTKPEYNDKINLMVALAPVVYVQNISNPIVQFLKDYYGIIDIATNVLNITEVLPHDPGLIGVLKYLCSDKSGFQDICLQVTFLAFGYDYDQFDTSTLPQILDSFPAGASMMEFKHYLQEVKSGYFRQYDYGILNAAKYGSFSPPSYNISEVTAPVALYYGKNDWLVGLPDVGRLIEVLPNVVEDYLIEYEQFNHFDFLYGKDVFSMLYYDVVNLINSHNGLEQITSTTTISTSSLSTSETSSKTSSKTSATTPNGNSDDPSNGDTSTPISTTPSSAPVSFKATYIFYVYFILTTVLIAYL